MGVFGDLFRLGKAGVQQSLNTDYAANLRQSADLAEQFAGLQAGQPTGTHGAATANPFDNLRLYAGMVQGTGTVVDLIDTGARLAGDTIFAVELDIALPQTDVYRTVYKTVIAGAALAGWQPGAVLPLRVSPTDPHAIMLG